MHNPSSQSTASPPKASTTPNPLNRLERAVVHSFLTSRMEGVDERCHEGPPFRPTNPTSPKPWHPTPIRPKAPQNLTQNITQDTPNHTQRHSATKARTDRARPSSGLGHNCTQTLQKNPETIGGAFWHRPRGHGPVEQGVTAIVTLYATLFLTV
jgi:hypothetical protein